MQTTHANIDLHNHTTNTISSYGDADPIYALKFGFWSVSAIGNSWLLYENATDPNSVQQECAMNLSLLKQTYGLCQEAVALKRCTWLAF